MLQWEKAEQRVSYELLAVFMGVCAATVTWAYGCTPAQDATAAVDIAALELPTQADCAYLAGAGPDVDLVCVGIEGLEDVLANTLRAAGQVKTPSVDAGAVQILGATIFVKVSGQRAAALMARVKRDGGQ